jgi:hypothetical protein
MAPGGRARARVQVFLQQHQIFISVLWLILKPTSTPIFFTRGTLLLNSSALRFVVAQR